MDTQMESGQSRAARIREEAREQFKAQFDELVREEREGEFACYLGRALVAFAKDSATAQSLGEQIATGVNPEELFVIEVSRDALAALEDAPRCDGLDELRQPPSK